MPGKTFFSHRKLKLCGCAAEVCGRGGSLAPSGEEASVTYKFYKAQVTGTGYLPEGPCLATLALDDKRNPTWSDVSEEFQRVCMDWFEQTVRITALNKFEPLKPYSEEALEHISKRQLPTQGYVMMTVKEAPKAPSTISFQPGIFTPPPGLLKNPPAKPEP
jgi:hypothetical protein